MGWPSRVKLGRLTPVVAGVLLLLAGTAAWGQTTASCWPQNSTLNRYHEYFCAVDAPPGSVVTGRQLMVALADLEPVPGYMVANAGGDQNRGGIRRRFQRVEEYGLPIVSGLTAGDVIQINEPWLRAVMSLLPVIVPQLRSWVGAATPPEWTAPPLLAPEGDIPLDSHGTASVTLYTRKEGGVRRVSIPVQTASTILGDRQPVHTARPQERHLRSGVTEGAGPKSSALRRGEARRQFTPTSWYILYAEAQARTADQREWWRQYELAWRAIDREMGPLDPSPVFLAGVK